VDITDTNNLVWEDGMTPEESRIYLESISNAKHLNADQRMQCNMFVGCIEYMESGGSRNDLDELLQKYEVIVPLNATKLEQKPIDNLKDIATLCKEIDCLTAQVDTLRTERDEARESYCYLMEAYRGGDGRVTANKLGWGYLFEEDKPCQ